MKNKLYITTTLLFALSIACFGQKDSNYIVSLSLNAGMGIPIDGFNSNSAIPNVMEYGAVKDPNMGLNGFTGNLGMHILPKHSHLGISLSTGYSNNGFDYDSYISSWQAMEYTQGYSILQIAQDGTPTTWQELNLMCGLFGTYSIKKLSLNLDLMAGVLYCQSPSFQFIAYYDYGGYVGVMPVIYNFYSSNSVTPACSITLKAEYELSNRLSIGLSYGGFYSTAQFIGKYNSEMPSNVTVVGGNYYTAYKYHTDVYLKEFTAGLTYKLGKPWVNKHLVVDSDFITATNTEPVITDTAKAIIPSSAYISLNGGYSLPTTRSSNPFTPGMMDISGLMMGGENYTISAGVPFRHSNFGIAAMGFYNYNNLDINGFVNSNRGNYFYTGFSSTPLQTSNTGFNEYGLLAGPFITLPLGRLNFDFRALVGKLWGTSPYVKVTSPSSELLMNSAPFEGISWTFDIGADARYSITKRFYALANFDFLYAKFIQASTAAQFSYSQNLYNQYPVGLAYYPLSVLNFTLGIGYKIGK